MKPASIARRSGGRREREIVARPLDRAHAAIVMNIVEWWRNRGRDFATYPQNANGDVLWQMHRSGDDLSKQRLMEFAFLFATQERARAFQQKAEPLGFEVEVSYFEAKRAWDVQCAVAIVPTHRDISRIENELSRLAATEEGRPDGWGCVAQ